MTIHPIPQARVVRKAGRSVTPPPAPPVSPEEGTVLSKGLRACFVYAIGLWPLTAVVLLMLGLLILAANNASY
jgi:hypothetical protein